MSILTDEQIAELIREVKILPFDYRDKLLVKMKTKGGHKQGEIEIVTDQGNSYSVKTRRNERNLFDFSVILVYTFVNSTRQFRLRRYNGRTTPHPNRLEKQRIVGFHIHQATERYQMAGFDEDAYAEATDRYTDLHGALNCMIADCGFVRPENEPPELL